MNSRIGAITNFYLAIGLLLSTLALVSYFINPGIWMRSCGAGAIGQGLAMAAGRSFFWAPEMLFWLIYRSEVSALQAFLPGFYPCQAPFVLGEPSMLG